MLSASGTWGADRRRGTSALQGEPWLIPATTGSSLEEISERSADVKLAAKHVYAHYGVSSRSPKPEGAIGEVENMRKPRLTRKQRRVEGVSETGLLCPSQRIAGGAGSRRRVTPASCGHQGIETSCK